MKNRDRITGNARGRVKEGRGGAGMRANTIRCHSGARDEVTSPESIGPQTPLHDGFRVRAQEGRAPE